MGKFTGDVTPLQKVQITIVAVVGLTFGAWGIRHVTPEVYRLLFTDLLVCSVPELVNEGRTIEVKVTGIIDAARILEEKTNSLRTGENWFTHYYYPFFDKDRKTGFYIYSELAPVNFLNQYSKGEVTIHGVWEEMPRDIQLQNPISRQFEQMLYLQQHLKSKDSENLIKTLNDFHQQEPLIIGRRLNLHPLRYKFDQTFMLITSTAFFILSITMLWIMATNLFRKRPTPKEKE